MVKIASKVKRAPRRSRSATARLTLALLVAGGAAAGAYSAEAAPGAAPLGFEVAVQSRSGQPRVLFFAPGDAPASALPTGGPEAAAQKAIAALRAQRPELIPAELGDAEVVPVGIGHVVRLPQLHRGVPVFGGELVVRLDAAGRLLRLTRDVVEPAGLAKLGTQPAIPAQAAQALVDKLGRGTTSAPILVIDVESEKLVYLVPSLGVNKSGVENAFYLVDATTGEMVRRIERINYLNQFRVYSANPVVDTAGRVASLPGEPLFAPTGAAPYKLDSTLIKGYNCLDEKSTRMPMGVPLAIHLCVPQQSVTSSTKGDFDALMPLVNGDDGKCPKKTDANTNGFAEAHMYFHVATVYDRFRGLFKGLNTPDFKLRVSVGGMARPFPVMVNLCMPDLMDIMKATNPNEPLQPFENAFFSPGDVNGGFSRLILGQDGDMIAFGQGAKANYSLDGDVVYHEFGHAVVSTVGRLRDSIIDDKWGRNSDPGAMNEGLADYFSAGISGDSAIGEYASKNFPTVGAAIRNIENDDHCANDRIGEIHEDSLAFTGALWAGRKAIAGNPKATDAASIQKRDAVDQAVLAALIGTSARPSMTEFAKLLVQEIKLRAAGLGADAEMKMTAALTQHGILAECDRIIKTPAPKKILCLDGDGRALMAGHVQWRIAVPGNADTIKVTLRTTDGACTQSTSLVNPPPKLQLLLRGGDMPVTWDSGKGTYDSAIDFTTAGTNLEAKIPMAKGVYHLMIGNGGGSVIGRDVSIETSCSSPQGCETLTPDMASSGVDMAADPNMPDPNMKGCGCRLGAADTERSAAAPTIFAGLAAMFAAFVLRRRRRA